MLDLGIYIMVQLEWEYRKGLKLEEVAFSVVCKSAYKLFEWGKI